MWFVVEYYVHLQAGYIAILVGALAGWGARTLGRMRGPTIGLIAAAAGVLGIAGGSYASYYARLHSEQLRAKVLADQPTLITPAELAEELGVELKDDDPNLLALTSQVEDAVFEESYAKAVNSDEVGYFAIMDIKDLLFMGFFGLLGLGYGYRVGSGGGGG